jgi:hypothetical protein
VSDALAAAWRAWCRAAGPWRRWSLCLPLVGPDAAALQADPPRSVPRPRLATAARALVAPESVRRTLVVLDLPPAAGVLAAVGLARTHGARPLLFLGRWPYAAAVLPAQPLIALLVREADRLPQAGLRDDAVVMVLDGERRRPMLPRSPRDVRADNRFEINGEDLPDVAALGAAGITTVLDVRPAGTPLAHPLARLAYPTYVAAGLEVRVRRLPAQARP